MRTYTVTSKSSTQIAADFAEAFKDVQSPSALQKVTAEARLAPYRSAIMKLRRRGLTWEQIAKGMAHPRINERVSDKLLRQVFGAKEAAAAPAPAANPAPQAADDIDDRVVLDPLTGLAKVNG